MLYDDKKFIGSVIRQARKHKGLSQIQLSERVGMTDKNLGNIENGKQFPQVNNFLRLMEELNLTVQDFGSNLPYINKYVNSDLLKIALSVSPQKAKAYLKILQTLDDVVMYYK